MSESAPKLADPGLTKLPCVNDALLSVPVWETRRAKNWLAIIDVDPIQPGGLSRKWVPRAQGRDLYYMVEKVSVFDAIEFGADRVAWSGNIVQNRWYGVVVEKTDTYLLIEQVESGAQAALVSRERQAGVPRPPPPPTRKPPPPPRPPTEDELQAWAEALQKGASLMKPPKQKRAKECMHEYLEAMGNRDYVKASELLSRSLTYKLQSAACMKAIDDAAALIRKPRPPLEP